MSRTTSPKRKKGQPDWVTARVAASVSKRADAIRDLLLSKGDEALPAKLRGLVTIPDSAVDRKAALRRFGIGQVFDLALKALEQATDVRSKDR